METAFIKTLEKYGPIDSRTQRLFFKIFDAACRSGFWSGLEISASLYAEANPETYVELIGRLALHYDKLTVFVHAVKIEHHIFENFYVLNEDLPVTDSFDIGFRKLIAFSNFQESGERRDT